MEEKGEKSGAGQTNKTPVKTEPSPFYIGSAPKSIFICSYAEALPVLNYSYSQSTHSQKVHIHDPTSPKNSPLIHIDRLKKHFKKQEYDPWVQARV